MVVTTLQLTYLTDKVIFLVTSARGAEFMSYGKMETIIPWVSVEGITFVP